MTRGTVGVVGGEDKGLDQDEGREGIQEKV